MEMVPRIQKLNNENWTLQGKTLDWCLCEKVSKMNLADVARNLDDALWSGLLRSFLEGVINQGDAQELIELDDRISAKNNEVKIRGSNPDVECVAGVCGGWH
jgi:hypothetical protein